jgi:bacillithiol biosynthesis cysteine-adding enzyme BshC
MPASVYSAYLDGGMRAGAFLPSSFGDREERVRRTREAATRPRPAFIPDGAAAVVTGQQCGLFLGPLYTLHKAASAIATARLLEAESGVQCVPIFWLQTEDHDFAEIASCRVGACELGLPLDDARVSIASRVLPAEVAPLVDSLASELEELPHAPEVCGLIAEHYRPGVPIARAFAGVLTALFEELTVIDPRDPEVARAAAPIVRRAITERAAIDALLERRVAELRAAGYTEQVKLRPGSPLAFFHADGAAGARARLDGDALDEAALLERLERDPLSFSTSALLRPIVEDSLLPTAAYVGGPAEVEYFAQLAPLYAHFGVPAPLVVPRARFRLIVPPVRRLLDALALQPADVEQPREKLLARLVRAPADAPSQAWLAELNARLDALAAAEPQLARPIARTRGSVRRNLERLERRHARGMFEREATLIDRVTRLQDWLFPDGKPQERVHSFAPFAAHAGPRALARALIAAADPLHPQIKDLAL